MYQQLYRQTMTCVDKGWSQVFSETTAAADDVEWCHPSPHCHDDDDDDEWTTYSADCSPQHVDRSPCGAVQLDETMTGWAERLHQMTTSTASQRVYGASKSLTGDYDDNCSHHNDNDGCFQLTGSENSTGTCTNTVTWLSRLWHLTSCVDIHYTTETAYWLLTATCSSQVHLDNCGLREVFPINRPNWKVFFTGIKCRMAANCSSNYRPVPGRHF